MIKGKGRKQPAPSFLSGLMYLDVPGPLVGLVGHLLLHAGELLLQVGHLILVEFGQVIELFLQPLVPGRGRPCDASPGSPSLPSPPPGSMSLILNKDSIHPHVQTRPILTATRKLLCTQQASQVLVVKNPPASAGDIRDVGSIPVSGRSPGEGNGNLLLYSCLENLIDRGDC